MNDLIKLVKLQQLWTTSAYDSLIQNKILACLQDLRVIGVAGVNVDTLDPLIQEAVLTYCAMNLGKPGKDEYDRLKSAYDEMKAQMQTSRLYGLAVADGEN